MKLINKLLGSMMLALGLNGAYAAGSAVAGVPHIKKGAFPQITLPERHAQGQRAVDVAGARLPEIAAWYRKSPDEFKSMLLNDRRMRLDQKGRAFFVEELEAPLAASGAAAASPGLLDGTLSPLDQTFLLHSRPGAKRTIYLNFKGATLTDTVWNTAGTITAAPFDIDGVPGTFSTTELQRIQYIWQRVAEDYAPFDVDVTTEAVASTLIDRTGSTDDVYGTTVLITNSTGVYSCSCGGIAYLGVFDDTSTKYKPALVFYNQLGGGNEKYVAEAISHEAGHNMGLAHDGTASVGYYQGHGSGATGWAPIMGVGYYQSLVQWSKGEYTGANNVQDDFVVMQSNGLPLRADDHGNTNSTATALTVTTSGNVSTGTAYGVIERSTDVDVFSFTAAAGGATITLSTASRSANLDGLITLSNAAGTVLATANPVDALNATLSFTLPAAGTYYVAVQGTGAGDVAATGYSNYGSLGQYAITASYAANTVVAGKAPVAKATASTLRGTAQLSITFSGAQSTDADGTIAAYDWGFGDGVNGSGSSVVHSYAVAGTYTAQLTVTDNTGMKGTSSVTIIVDAPVAAPTMNVSKIDMSLTVPKNGNANANAAVVVLNAAGQPVSGATVIGNWSGIVARKNDTITTDGTGVARFASPKSTRGGTFIFTVTSVKLTGSTYNAQSNVETSDSITR